MLLPTLSTFGTRYRPISYQQRMAFSEWIAGSVLRGGHSTLWRIRLLVLSLVARSSCQCWGRLALLVVLVVEHLWLSIDQRHRQSTNGPPSLSPPPLSSASIHGSKIWNSSRRGSRSTRHPGRRHGLQNDGRRTVGNKRSSHSTSRWTKCGHHSRICHFAADGRLLGRRTSRLGGLQPTTWNRIIDLIDSEDTE